MMSRWVTVGSGARLPESSDEHAVSTISNVMVPIRVFSCLRLIKARHIMIYSFGGDNDEYIEREIPDHYYTVPGSQVRYAEYFGSGKLDNAIAASASHQKP
jgi:hypothetical protein